MIIMVPHPLFILVEAKLEPGEKPLEQGQDPTDNKLNPYL